MKFMNTFPFKPIAKLNGIVEKVDVLLILVLGSGGKYNAVEENEKDA